MRARHAPGMSVRERRVAAGSRRGADLGRMIGREIRNGRRMAGVSQDQLGAAVGVSGSEVGRVENGSAPWLTVIHASELLSAVGLDLWAKTYPAGPPLRDAAHLRLLADFEARLHPSIKCQREWPIPNDRDRRAIDLLLTKLPMRIGVEAETVINDLQALQRDINLKQRDTEVDGMILLARGSRWNRALLRAADALRRDFPIPTRGLLASLAHGHVPSGNGIVIL